MTADEWEGICLLLESGWPGEFSDSDRVAYRTLLGDHDAARVVAALKALTKRGGTFRPSVAEIAGALAADPSIPVFSEAFAALMRCLPVFPDERALERADNYHPYLGAFVRAVGLERLRMWPLNDPDYFPVERQRLREEWERFVERAEVRTSHGLPIDQGGARRELGPRRIDYLAALEAGPEEPKP